MADKKKISLGKELTKGIIKENPTLVMLLGMCPTLAVTTQATNVIDMGLRARLCFSAPISLSRF